MTTCASREVVLDTETTGLEFSGSDRIVEIGCVELINGMPIGVRFQRYVNPMRSMPSEAEAVHGLSDEFLADKPAFADVADEFLAFIGDAPLVMHNAPFDLGFLNAELRRCKRRQIATDRAVDTLVMAGKRYPGKRLSLDALCNKLEISLDGRQKHGALVDALLLAEVYLELQGGRQASLSMSVETTTAALPGISPSEWIPLLVHPSEAELAAHAAFVATLQNAVWRTM